MKRTFCAIATVLLSIPLIALATGTSTAQEATYQESVFKTWDTTTLDVLIVPPHHGEIYNGNGPLGGGNPMEATPFNSYLLATEDSIAAWDEAIARFAPDWLASTYETNPYVIGRDLVPPEALEDPEIVITASEHKGHILGVAVNLAGNHCVINNSMFWTASYTYTDMYNISTHEFGHCLGAGHIVSDEPTHDVMFPTYNDTVGAKDNHEHCISNLNVMTLEASFAPSDSDATPAPEIPISQYATTCSAAGASAPAPQPSGSAASPSSAPQSMSSPSPTPAPASSPAPTPTPSPTDTSSSPSEPTDIFRGIELSLRKHLVAKGQIASNEAGCIDAVSVEIARRKNGVWRIATVTSTDDAGLFKVKLEDRPGKYRAQIGQGETSDGRFCNAAQSHSVRHGHAG